MNLHLFCLLRKLFLFGLDWIKSGWTNNSYIESGWIDNSCIEIGWTDIGWTDNVWINNGWFGIALQYLFWLVNQICNDRNPSSA